MSKGLIFDRYAFKRMAFAYKKPKMGFMNIENMVKSFPRTDKGLPTAIGAQHARFAYAAHENAGTFGTVMYKGHKMPAMSAAVGLSIQKGALITPDEIARRRDARLRETANELADLQQKGFGQFMSVSSQRQSGLVRNVPELAPVGGYQQNNYQPNNVGYNPSLQGRRNTLEDYDSRY